MGAKLLFLQQERFFFFFYFFLFLRYYTIYSFCFFLSLSFSLNEQDLFCCCFFLSFPKKKVARIARPNDKVFLLTCIPPTDPSILAICSTTSLPQLPKKDSVSDFHKPYLEIFEKDRKEEERVVVESLVREGDAREVICTICLQLYIDVLVLGTRGRSGLRRSLLGSVSDYCSRHSPCAVLLVREKMVLKH